MKSLTYIILLVISLVSTSSYADCISDGKKYKQGDRVGPFVCENGRWVRR